MMDQNLAFLPLQRLREKWFISTFHTQRYLKPIAEM